MSSIGKRKKRRNFTVIEGGGDGSSSHSALLGFAKAGGEFYVRKPEVTSWLSVAEIDDLGRVNAWLAEGGQPPIGASYLKWLRGYVENIPAEDFIERDIVDRPGRSGTRYITCDGNVLRDAGADQPELGFRTQPDDFCEALALRDWMEIAQRLSIYPIAAAVTGLALSSVVHAYAPAEINAGCWIQGRTGKTTMLRWGASLCGDPHRLVKPHAAVGLDLDLAMHRYSGASLMVDDAVLETAKRTPKGSMSVSDVLRQLSAGKIDCGIDAMSTPHQLGFAIASRGHLADHLVNLPHNEAAAVLDRTLILSLDELPIPNEALQEANEAITAAHGSAHWRFANRVRKKYVADPVNFVNGLHRREQEFKEKALCDLGVDSDNRIVDVAARLHAVNAFAVFCDILPEAYDDDSLLLQCLAAQRRAATSLTPYEQLLELAADATVVDLRYDPRPDLTDEQLKDALFIRQNGNKLQLLLTHEKLAASVRHPALFLLDPAVRRAFRPDTDHSTRQVRVRRNAGDDRLLCFDLPWPVRAAA